MPEISLTENVAKALLAYNDVFYDCLGPGAGDVIACIDEEFEEQTIEDMHDFWDVVRTIAGNR